MKKNLRTTLQTLVFLALGLFLFYWALSDVSLPEILEDIAEADSKWILLAMVCGALSHLARALRWNLLLEPLGYKVSEHSSFHAVILGYLVNMAVPRLGEVTRPAVLSKLEKVPFNKAVGTVVSERVIDMIITILIAISIFFLQFSLIKDFTLSLVEGKSKDQMLWFAAILLLLAALFVAAIVYRKYIYALPVIAKFKNFFEGIVDGIRSIFKMKRKGLFIFYSLFIWFMYFMMPYLVLFSLEGTAHLGVSAGMTILLFGTAAMIVPVPGGLGTFEVLVPAALVLYGVSGAIGDTYAVLTHAVQVVLIFAIGAVSVVYFLIKNQKIKKNGLE